MIASRLEQTYQHFCAFCMTVGIEKPMAAQLWLAITDYVLKDPPNPPVPATRPHLSGVAAYCPPRNPENDKKRAEAAQANEQGMQIGELHADGAVRPPRPAKVVRHQNECMGRSLLLARTCRGPCGLFLPFSQFYKQGKSQKSICKKCDNARRRKTLAMSAD